MSNLKSLLGYLFEDSSSSDDYRGVHKAPDKSDAPLWDVTKDIYPDDIYTLPLDLAARYYGASEPGDMAVTDLVRRYRNKPNAKVKIYRAVPRIKTREEEIAELEDFKRQIMRRGKANTTLSYDSLSNRVDKLRQEIESGLPEKENIKEINPGDWVTIYRPYAKEHGEGALNGEYKILTKTVTAKELFTDGNSLYEWGWSP